MQLKDSQFTIIHNELKSTPLLPWEMVKKLLWDLDKNLMEDIDCIAQECNWHFKYFIDGFSHFKNYSIVIADKDLTICAASSNIYDMTGYTAEEMVGNRPSILQGVDTNEDSKFLLKIAIDEEVPFHSRLVNYTKDGTSYGCEIHSFPIYDGTGNLSHFIAFESEYYA
ncbi:hypothetical protein A9Q93_06860 [Nonlabens dokdonensis]|uniref:PAS domain-containing protein n=1 Tax=Nonlabens dokdonensis TaxID=328515 RepID=A0A1Z8AZ31_9FLAO|nr:PAS domain-containing protein [Nonlabens dokdonensis]OUS15458.1 hypothetical protein A9Q93_06860 [Nonlabens dokdonensis]